MKKKRSKKKVKLKEYTISNAMDPKLNKEVQRLGPDYHQTMRGILSKIEEKWTLSDETKEKINL